MNFISGNAYHIYNQGNNKQQIFFCDDDYLIFLRMIRKLLLPQCEILCYCLMPNHFHLMIYVDERANTIIKQGGLTIDVITNACRKLLSGYARIINEKYNRSGSLFRQKTKVKNLSEIKLITAGNTSNEYNLACFNYIHQNPVKAKLVSQASEWIYSSYQDYMESRNGSICNKNLAMTICDFSNKDIVCLPDQFIVDEDLIFI